MSTLIASKQDTLSAGENITIVDNIISSSFEDIASQSDLHLKQDLINTSTNIGCNDIISNDITCNDLTSSTLNVSGVNMADIIKTDNTVITGSQFDTIVIRRPTGVSEFSSNYIIDLREIQVWAKNVNILQKLGSYNVTTLTSMFALWSSKTVDLGYHSTFSPDKIYNNSIETVVGTHWKDPSSDPRVALIRTGYLYRSSWAF